MTITLNSAGTFGRVYRGLHSGMDVAIKELVSDQVDKDFMTNYQTEVSDFYFSLFFI